MTAKKISQIYKPKIMHPTEPVQTIFPKSKKPFSNTQKKNAEAIIKWSPVQFLDYLGYLPRVCFRHQKSAFSKQVPSNK